MEGCLNFNLKTHPNGHFRSAKPRAKRSKSGCQSCRLRRKKCDENRPICNGCRDNHLLCSWPKDPHPTSPPPCRKQAHHIRPQGRSSPLPSEIPPSKHLQIAPGQSIIAVPSDWPQLDHREVDKRLIQHFIVRTAWRLSITDQHSNPFLQFVLPRAAHNDLLLHVILSISASHLSYQDQSMREVAMSHYAIALRSVKHQITNAVFDCQTEIMDFLMVLLALCQFEVC